MCKCLWLSLANSPTQIFVNLYLLSNHQTLCFKSSLVEQHTKEQSKSRLWYSYRAGRITASKFKAAVSTDGAMPSQSLIKSICYPEQHKFSSASTK